MDGRGRRQPDLHADVDAVREYGKRFPDTWTDVMFDGDRLVALFTDPDEHREAVAALVAHPDRVDVRAAKRSARETKKILNQIVSRLTALGGHWTSYGSRLDVVSVDLYGDAEDIARELHERFGDAVELKVGAHAYPFADPPPSVPPIPAPQPTVRIDAAELRAIPDSAVVAVGQGVTGNVEITNVTTGEEFAFATDQPLLGQFLDGDRVLSVCTSPVAGTGQHVMLRPGEVSTIGFFADAHTLDLRDGATLPPGRYQLVVTIPVYSLAGERLRDQQLVTPPVPIDIVAGGNSRA